MVAAAGPGAFTGTGGDPQPLYPRDVLAVCAACSRRILARAAARLLERVTAGAQGRLFSEDA